MNIMVNFLRRDGSVHPVMSPRQIVVERKLVIPLYPPGSSVYGVPGNTSNSIDKMRFVDALYIQPNEERGGILYTTSIQWSET